MHRGVQTYAKFAYRMQLTQEEQNKRYYTKILNLYQKKYPVSYRTLFVRDIKNRILPIYFHSFLHIESTFSNTCKKARQRFNSNIKLKNRIMERDGWKCMKCKSTQYLEIDHIVPIKQRPDLANVSSNLRTLCKPCHKKRHARKFRMGYPHITHVVQKK